MMKEFLALALYICFNFNLMSQQLPKLLYFGDPMCSWCYGFSPELSKVVDELGSEIEMEMIMGGLRPYNAQSMTELKSFLTDHWKEVNHRSGQEFKYGILDSEEITYDTEPPSRAFIIVRALCPGDEFKFFKELQSLFYFENKNMHLAETYFAAVEELGLSREEFVKHFESDFYKKEIKEDFQKSSAMGVRGFPTLLLQKGEELYLISNGFMESASVIGRIKAKL